MTHEERQYNAFLEVVEESVTDEEFAEILKQVSVGHSMKERFNLLASIANRVIPEAPFRVSGQLRNDLLNASREASETGDVTKLRKVFEKIDAEQPRLRTLREGRKFAKPPSVETQKESLTSLMSSGLDLATLSQQDVAHSMIQAVDTQLQQALGRSATSAELLTVLKNQEQMIEVFRAMIRLRARQEKNEVLQ